MRERAVSRATAIGLTGTLKFEFTADMRFVGQAFEVSVPFIKRELSRQTDASLRQRFAEAHHRVYFFGGEADKPVEFVSFRLALIQPIKDLPLLQETATSAVSDALIDLYDKRSWQRGRLKSRASLKQRDRVRGPALLEDATSTLFVPDGWTARRDGNDNTILERK
jgi:N-methylhydantoinase A